MSEFQYLAAIGKRGGRISRRELTKSHARQMGRNPRDEARGDQKWKAVATTQSQVAQAHLS
jgi:hypothetical protein